MMLECFAFAYCGIVRVFCALARMAGTHVSHKTIICMVKGTWSRCINNPI